MFWEGQLRIPRGPDFTQALVASLFLPAGGMIMRLIHSLAVGLIVPIAFSFAMGQQDLRKIELFIVEKKTGKPVPCRIHLKDKNGKPQRALALPFWHDHFVCQGIAQLQLHPGEYTYEVERGPEYVKATGTFTVNENNQVKINVELERLLNLKK